MKSTKSLLLLIILVASLALLMAYLVAKKNAENKLQSSIEVQLLQIVNELEITLERHSYLPSLLSNDSDIRKFLRTPKATDKYAQRQESINLSLELTNNISGTTSIFLMNPVGEVVSSSNWAEKESFIKQDFSSWPYFKQASQNALGRHFTSQSGDGERYYFFARSVQFNNKVIGVIAAQVPLSAIASNWISEIDFVVTDNNGSAFLSSNKKLESLGNDGINLKYEGFQVIQLFNKKHQMLSKRMELANWDVRVLSEYSIAQKEISRNVLISSIVIFLISALTGLLLKIQNQRKEFRQRARLNLENKVRERTKALKRSQEDLIQAAKMAALGQLSTGITHEINNPLTAIRAYADNAGQFLKKDRLDMVESNLHEITKLTESMAAITGQLKSFARKSKGDLTSVNINDAIVNAISIINSKIVSSGTNINYGKTVVGKTRTVLADEIWLSQILVNLISNAISATNNNLERNIWINITEITVDSILQYCIEIRDNGPGIEESNLHRIFEPFFTTKPTTKGLGLGLSISFNLAKDMNGSLDARNHEKGGALFTLCLPSTQAVNKQ
ncbi:MAG: ATP-binding protein [Cocleimonas sp.]